MYGSVVEGTNGNLLQSSCLENASSVRPTNVLPTSPVAYRADLQLRGLGRPDFRAVEEVCISAAPYFFPGCAPWPIAGENAGEVGAGPPFFFLFHSAFGFFFSLLLRI